MAIKIQGTTVIDDSRNATNLGDITASGDVNFTGSGSFKVPSGTTSQRPASPSVGEIRYNTDNSEFEQYDGSGWVALSPPIDKGTLDKTFAAGESASIALSEPVSGAPVVSVTKEVPQVGITSNDWDVAADGSNFTLHDTAYDTTLTPETIIGNIDDASYNDVSFDVSGQDGIPSDLIFNDDGTKMFLLGAANDRVFQYSLSTEFDISTAFYDNVSFSFLGVESDVSAVSFNNNGTKLYVTGTNTDSVHQYSLSTAYDIDTASYDNISFSLSGQDTAPLGIAFNTDGTKMYILGAANDSVHQYTLSTAFDLSTASYDSVSFSVSGQDTAPLGIAFNTDGTKMYILGYDSYTVYQYSLSTAFDLSSASYDSISFTLSSQFVEPRGIAFSADGSIMYIVANGDDNIDQYDIPSFEALVLGSGSFASTDVGKRIVGNGGEAVLTAADGSYELQTSFNDDSTIAAGDWSMFGLDVESADAGLTLAGLSQFYNLENVSYDSVSFDVSGQDTAAIAITFNNDGTKMYMVGNGNNSVYQYSLGTAFDLSTASYDNASFSVGTQEPAPTGIVFNNDGTKFYVCGTNTDSVYEYVLSTAFDISTASYNNSSLDLSAIGNPYGIVLNNDGTKLYFVENTNDSVHQYSLTTAYDLSTATSDNVSFSVAGQDGFPTDITFNTDGTKMFIVGLVNDTVYQYTLSTAFDLSTASYDNVSLDVSSQETNPYGISFNNNGTKMYIVGVGTNSVYQYTTSLFVLPTNTNHTAVTSTSTDTEFWTDINSMTADDAVNDGAVYYAVSTDDRTTWSIIDDANGVRNIVRNNGGTWEVNDASDYATETWVAATENDEFYALEEAVDIDTAQVSEVPAPADQWSYDNVSFDVSGQTDGFLNAVTFNDSGSKMYISRDAIYQYSLSNAFDVNSASYDSVSLNVSSNASDPQNITFNDIGTKFYLIDLNGIVYQYDLTSAYDLSTASYANKSFDASGEGTNTIGFSFNNNGTKMYVSSNITDQISQYSLSTSFDVTTASYDNVSLDVSQQDDVPLGITFNNDGTRVYLLGQTNSLAYQYDLTTAFDLTTASYSNIFFDISNQLDGAPRDIAFDNQGTQMYIAGLNGVVYQYTSSITTSTNRMDATQLNAVTDANHYTLGNDLDLAITLFMADGNTNSPTSDGVSINYDANVLNQGAVLGTDYEFDAPAGDTVRITALSDENFKVKVI